MAKAAGSGWDEIHTFSNLLPTSTVSLMLLVCESALPRLLLPPHTKCVQLSGGSSVFQMRPAGRGSLSGLGGWSKRLQRAAAIRPPACDGAGAAALPVDEKTDVVRRPPAGSAIPLRRRGVGTRVGLRIAEINGPCLIHIGGHFGAGLDNFLCTSQATVSYVAAADYEGDLIPNTSTSERP